MSRAHTPVLVARSNSMLALQEAPGHLVRLAQQRHTQLWAEEFAGALTGPQYAVICAVAAEGGSTQRAVGERASLDTSSMSDLVSRLSAQGWLRLDRDAHDGRRKCVDLTLPARAALPEMTRRAALVQQRLLEPVRPRDRRRFLEAMRIVAYAGTGPSPVAPEGGLSLADTPGHLIRRTQQVHTLTWSTEVGNSFTAPQYAVLSALWAHRNGVDQTTAGQQAGLDKSSMADVVSRLARRGWITRSRDTRDGRFQMLCLTEAARADLPSITAAVRRVQETLLAPLTQGPQRAIFMAGYRRLALPLDVPGQSAPGAGP